MPVSASKPVSRSTAISMENTSAEKNGFLSMTGYAVVELAAADRRYRLHLKSVNHRFFEFRWKAPRNWMPLENEARQLFQQKVVRGSVDFWAEEATAVAGADTSGRVSEFFAKLTRAAKGQSSFWSSGLLRRDRAMILSR